MKYSFSIISLFLVLFVTLYGQKVFSQTPPMFDTPRATTIEQDQQLLQSIINPDTGLPQGIQEQISIQQLPTIPKPGETVSVQITSYSTDLNKATITWTLDGRELISQVGATRFSFQAPQSGETSTLIIKIQKEFGGTISNTIVISPADVDLLYEAQTYAHPFYKGKKLFTSESIINFIALPNFVDSSGRKIPDSNLVYTWKINGTVQQSNSGYGQNTFAMKGTLIERSNVISVDVSAVNSSLKASQSIRIQSQKPEVVLYENNPVLGVVYEQAIQGSFNLTRPQVDFEGVPYFFSSTFKDSNDLKFNWSLNGQKIATKAPNENYLVLRNDRNEEGRALINVSLEHINNILQTTQSSLELNFGKINNIQNEAINF